MTGTAVGLSGTIGRVPTVTPDAVAGRPLDGGAPKSGTVAAARVPPAAESGVTAPAVPIGSSVRAIGRVDLPLSGAAATARSGRTGGRRTGPRRGAGRTIPIGRAAPTVPVARAATPGTVASGGPTAATVAGATTGASREGAGRRVPVAPGDSTVRAAAAGPRATTPVPVGGPGELTPSGTVLGSRMTTVAVASTAGTGRGPTAGNDLAASVTAPVVTGPTRDGGSAGTVHDAPMATAPVPIGPEAVVTVVTGRGASVSIGQRVTAPRAGGRAVTARTERDPSTVHRTGGPARRTEAGPTGPARMSGLDGTTVLAGPEVRTLPVTSGPSGGWPSGRRGRTVVRMARGTVSGPLTYGDRIPRTAGPPASGWSVDHPVRRATNGATAAPISARTACGVPTRAPVTRGQAVRPRVARRPVRHVPGRTRRPSAGR